MHTVAAGVAMAVLHAWRLPAPTAAIAPLTVHVPASQTATAPTLQVLPSVAAISRMAAWPTATCDHLSLSTTAQTFHVVATVLPLAAATADVPTRLPAMTAAALSTTALPAVQPIPSPLAHVVPAAKPAVRTVRLVPMIAAAALAALTTAATAPAATAAQATAVVQAAAAVTAVAAAVVVAAIAAAAVAVADNQ